MGEPISASWPTRFPDEFFDPLPEEELDAWQ
jgi:hypothetical protein